MTKAKILLIEDDEEISRLTGLYLEADGYDVVMVNDGAEALTAIAEQSPDLIILDLMLPNISGHKICQQAREASDYPILVLTALDDDFNEVSLLKLGADDYLSKPVKPHVLVARIEAILRRYQTIKCPANVGSLKLDTSTYTATLNDKIINLTEAEFELLSILHKNKKEPVTRTDCCYALRGIDYEVCDRSIDMRISGLRKKLGDINRPYEIIVTVRNKGYLLNAN
jgi:two-component system, OmpR family, response regulator RstA